MKPRSFWQRVMQAACRRRSVVWLAGVRRAGKTVLCQSLPRAEYFDLELPRARRAWEDPEAMLASLRGRLVVLDEIHRFGNPSEILKIAADHYPDVRIVATGSSSLGASAKFRDTLAGRKAEVWLTPMNERDLRDFGNEDLLHRFTRGGLPPFFLAERLPERDFQEWMEAYWAKDILELFRLEKRDSFQKFAELLMAQSGGVVLEATFVAHVPRPFSTHRATEIVSAPKVYGFDTGFVCYHRGWHRLRKEDMGLLWEHYVLNEIHARLQSRRVLYWRDKRDHEVDFVIAPRRGAPVAIECKWSTGDFDPRNLVSFRTQYPRSTLLVVGHDVDRPFVRSYRGARIAFVGLEDLIARLSRKGV
jgi:predicted AAA+ superfamily ATPase